MSAMGPELVPSTLPGEFTITRTEPVPVNPYYTVRWGSRHIASAPRRYAPRAIVQRLHRTGMRCLCLRPHTSFARAAASEEDDAGGGCGHWRSDVDDGVPGDLDADTGGDAPTLPNDDADALPNDRALSMHATGVGDAVELELDAKVGETIAVRALCTGARADGGVAATSRPRFAFALGADVTLLPLPLTPPTPLPTLLHIHIIVVLTILVRRLFAPPVLLMPFFSPPDAAPPSRDIPLANIPPALPFCAIPSSAHGPAQLAQAEPDARGEHPAASPR
ncbi:hypothetical protein C8J57DRAFT_1522593 [Mycena rebaudengoi]|nr:hypothetical protein C8J57DRAFT_1522593 [Mycena rebaudengoi]